MSKTKTLSLSLLTMLLWGTLFPMVKLGFSAYEVKSTADILLFAGVRFTICGAIICFFTFLKDKSSYRAAGSSIVPILVAGIFAISLHYGFSYIGLELTDSSKTALIKQVGSLLYVCFSFLFIKEDKPTVKKIIAAVIGFLGIIALNIDSSGFSFHIGDVLILCSSFCLVFSNIISKKVFSKVAPITTTGISQVCGGIVLLIVGTLMGGKVSFRADTSIFIMLYICSASVVSYCIWYYVMKNGELSKLFIIKFSEPIFACVFGAIILGENIWKIQYLIALILICLAVWISNMDASKKLRKNEDK